MEKFADSTGFEVHRYETEQKVTNLGKKTNRTLKIKKSALREMSKELKNFSEERDAAIFMLGGEGNLISRVIQFPHQEGCADTSYVSPQRIANAAGTLIALGEWPLGFGVVRRKVTGEYDGSTDSLINNLKTWQVLFPGCYVILLARSSRYAWHLEKKGIKRISLQVVKDSTRKKGGKKHGRKKNHRKSLPSRKECRDRHSGRRINRGRRSKEAKNRGKG